MWSVAVTDFIQMICSSCGLVDHRVLRRPTWRRRVQRDRAGREPDLFRFLPEPTLRDIAFFSARRVT
jgi:hypothetical protein